MSSRTAWADQEWQPSYAVELLVGAGPGGGNDKIARMLQRLMRELKLTTENIIVLNKPGAGGALAQGYMNSHSGNGHYVLMENPALITNFLVGIGNASYSDVTPIAQILADYIVFVTSTGSSVRSAQDLVAALRRDPGQLNVAVAPGLGTGPHIAIALLAQSVGVDPRKLHIVPFNSSTDAITAVLGGHVDIMPSTGENTVALIDSGLLRALAVTAPNRLHGSFTETPTLRDLGFDVIYNNWRGIVGPKNLPAPQLAYWERVCRTVHESALWRELTTEAFLVPDYQDSARFAATLAQENVAMRATLSTLGLLKAG